MAIIDYGITLNVDFDDTKTTPRQRRIFNELLDKSMLKLAMDFERLVENSFDPNKIDKECKESFNNVKR